MKTLCNTSLLMVGLVALALFTGCDSNGGNSDESVVGSFTGRAIGVVDLVSVIAGTPAANGQRTVRVYLCDAKTHGEWFAGQIAGNTLDMVSVTGNARLQATLVADHASGAIILDDGTRLAFDVPPTRDGAGLYHPFVVDADGRVSSTSPDGAVLRAHLNPDHTVETGSITLPDGTVFTYQHTMESALEPGTYTAIALPAAEEIRGFDVRVKTEVPEDGYRIRLPPR